MKTINGMLVVVITALLGVLCGCSQEDDGYDNAEMYTLAEEMGTRGGGGDPGNNVKKRRISFTRTGDNHYQPKAEPNTTNIIISGEYNTSTLTISINNYSGNATIYIQTIQGDQLMDSATMAVSDEAHINFSVTNYTIGARYQIYVILGSDTYYGVFDL